MDIDIKKNGKIKLKDTPYFEPIDNTNISFSNMDIGTAMLTFQIKKNGLPLQVSKKNVYVYCYLESRNGTRSEVIELDVVDALQGKASLQLDSEFLIGATNTTVDGQLYITMHKFNDVPDDFSDTVALQEFTFTVKDALINEISGVTKTQYIRTFDQLRTEVKDKIKEMQENIGNIETLVDRVKQASQDAINKVNDTKDAMIKDMQTQYDSTETELIELRESSIQKLELSATNYINDIKNAKDELVQMISDENLITTQKFEEYKSDLDEEIETRLDEYEDFINQNKDNFEGIINELDWQKYKLTEDDGQRIRISDTDPVELDTGYYQMWRVKNAPVGSDDNGQYWNVDVLAGYDNTKQIIATISYTGKTYKKNIHKNEDKGWKDLNNNQSDTGWAPFQLINGAKTNSAYDYGTDRNGFGCAYRTIKRGDVTEKHLRINGSNVTHGQIIAQLPDNFAKSPQVGFVRAPLNHNGTSIIIENNGEIKVYIANEPEWEKSDGKYIYGTISWVE